MQELIHRKESFYFKLLLAISIPTYALLAFSGIGILILLLLGIIPLLFHWISMGMIRGNGVKVTAQQFPEVYERAVQLCEKMEIASVPDIYIIQSGGFLNAFATRFFRKNMIVLYAEVFELIRENAKPELEYIIAHELAHIKRNHIVKHMLILPGNWIPFLGEAYSRACEYTCDQMALHYTENRQAAANALTILTVGKSLYRHVNIEQHLKESSQEANFFVWFAEKVSTHPATPKRIHHLSIFSGGETNVSFKMSRQTKAVLTFLPLMLVLVAAGVYSGGKLFKDSSLYSDFVLGSEETTPLMLAASEGDVEKAEELLKEGADVNAADASGWTAFHHSVYSYNEDGLNKDMLILLLQHGADPVQEDSEGDTPAHILASNGENELLTMILKKGIDVNTINGYGDSLLMSAVYSDNPETVKLLLEAGADPNIKDAGDRTALQIAKEDGYPKIEKVLKEYKKK